MFALKEGKASREHDLLWFLLSNVGEKGESLTQVEIRDNIFRFYLQFMKKEAQLWQCCLIFWQKAFTAMKELLKCMFENALLMSSSRL